MNGWLLDTNVLSELRRKKPSPAVVDFVSAQPLDSLFVSEVTFAEIRFGIELVSEPTRRAELRQWLDHRLRPMFTHPPCGRNANNGGQSPESANSGRRIFDARVPAVGTCADARLVNTRPRTVIAVGQNTRQRPVAAEAVNRTRRLCTKPITPGFV